MEKKFGLNYELVLKGVLSSHVSNPTFEYLKNYCEKARQDHKKHQKFSFERT